LKDTWRFTRISLAVAQGLSLIASGPRALQAAITAIQLRWPIIVFNEETLLECIVPPSQALFLPFHQLLNSVFRAIQLMLLQVRSMW
jgi:hypothetical protein